MRIASALFVVYAAIILAGSIHVASWSDAEAWSEAVWSDSYLRLIGVGILSVGLWLRAGWALALAMVYSGLMAPLGAIGLAVGYDRIAEASPNPSLDVLLLGAGLVVLLLALYVGKMIWTTTAFC